MIFVTEDEKIVTIPKELFLDLLWSCVKHAA